MEIITQSLFWFVIFTNLWFQISDEPIYCQSNYPEETLSCLVPTSDKIIYGILDDFIFIDSTFNQTQLNEMFNETLNTI